MQDGDLIKFYGPGEETYKGIYFLVNISRYDIQRHTHWTLKHTETKELLSILSGRNIFNDRQNFRKLNIKEVRDFKIKQIKEQIS